jgi:hypothetical protein
VDAGAQPRSLLTLVGWVASEDKQIEHIWLACRGKKLASAKVFQRLDVQEAYADRQHVVGFEICALPLVLGSDEPLKIAMEVAGGKRTTLFEVGLQFADSVPDSASAVQAPESGAGVLFAPIVALPRSGTTFLSQLLHSSAAVLGDDLYPYELRFAEHFVNEWFSSIQPWAYAAPADRRSDVVDPNFSTICNILRAGDENPGANRRGVERLFDAGRRHYLDKISELYRLAAPKPKGYVIAEKIGLGIELDLLAALADSVKPIFLIRDPRDVLLSMRSFNEKRGIYEFHEPRTKHFIEVVNHTSADLLHLTECLDRWKGDRLLIRYDELVADPAGILRKTLEYLRVPKGMGADPALLAAATSGSPDVHVTSASPTESVGRWRNELTPSEIAIADWHFQPFLQRFGF